MTNHEIAIKEASESRDKLDAEMMEELDRVKALLATRGIHERMAGEHFDRIVKVSNRVNYCEIKSTCFKVPENINLEKVVWWIINKTKFSSCVVFLGTKPPTTIWTNKGIEYFFK